MAIENGILKPSGAIQLRGGTAAVMASENPLLLRREMAVEVDTGKSKVGNGTDRWNALPYSGGGGSGDHEELDGLLGGAAAGHYHMTQDQNRRLAILINALFPNGDDNIYIPVVDDSDPENPILLPYTPFQNLPTGTPPDWVQVDMPAGYTAYSGVHKMFYGSRCVRVTSSSSTLKYWDNSLLVLVLMDGTLHTVDMLSLDFMSDNGEIVEPSSGGNYPDWVIAKGPATHGRSLYYVCGNSVMCSINNDSNGSQSGFTVVDSAALSDCNSLCYSEDLDIILAVGATGDVVVMSYSSSNNRFSGSASSKYTIGITVNPSSAAWSSDELVFCVTGAEGTATSPDGATWETHTGNDVPKNMGDLSFREDLGCFLARGLTDKYFYVSSDGETWQKLTNTPIPLETVTAVDYTPATGIYCAVGGIGKNAYFSKDLDTWVSTTIANGSDIEAGSVIYMPSTKKYVLMPTSGSYYYTFDPSDWITDCADTHNGHPSNNDLGEFNASISAAIRSGAFTGIYPGDYFSFTNVAYDYIDENGDEQSSTFTGTMRIMHLDYPQYCGYAVLPHCALVAPDAPFFTAQMNATDTIESGYVGSKMRTVYLRRARAIFEACFGAEHIVSYTENLVNAVDSTTGVATGVEQCDCDVELMDERMVYGDYKLTAGAHNRRIEPESLIFPHRQLAAFEHNHELVKTNMYWWLRNVVSAGCFAYVTDHGSCFCTSASNSGGGVRPFALIN